MAVNYTFAEQTDMLLVLGFCQGSCRASVTEYGNRYPNRRLPNHQTFAAVERRLRETGNLTPQGAHYGHHRTIRTPDIEEEVLERINENPELSTRRLGLEIGVSKDTVHRVLKEQLLHPYHLQPVHDLLPIDTGRRLAFCRLLREKRVQDANFCNNILFTDEACFTRRGIINMRNEHVYADENPHATKLTHFQHEFSINVWTGIIGNYIIGPVRLPNRLGSEEYLQFLRHTFPNLLDDLPLELRHNMWFMHDGAPAHFGLNVRNYLNRIYPERWIGRGNDAPINWPPRSPDLNPCDFFLWGALKCKVYGTPLQDVEELWRRIQYETNTIGNNNEVMQRVQFNFLRRINLCLDVNGGHIEQLL